MQLKERQAFGDLRRAAHVGRQDHAVEPPSLPILVHPLVVDPRSPNLNRSRSQEDLTFPGAPVANDQGVAVLVALILGRIEIGFDLRLGAWASIFLAPGRAISSRSSMSSSRFVSS